MVLSYDEWLQQNPELQNPLMFDNSDFIKKLSQSDWEQVLQFLFLMVQKDRDFTKSKLTSLINNYYIGEKKNDISQIDIREIRNYVTNIL